MRIFRQIAVLSFLTAVGVTSAYAQPGTQRPATPQPTPVATQSPVTVAIPPTKIALINTAVFSDEKVGISRLIKAVKQVNAEFDPRRKELEKLQTTIETLEAELIKTKPVITPLSAQQKQDQIDLLKRDYQRKGEDATSAFNRRLQEVLAPIQEDIGKALDIFAKARGITLTLDGSKMPDAIMTLDEATDITKAFIADFNAKNPVTASNPVP